MKNRLAAAMAILAAILTAASCATSAGTLLSRVLDAEEADRKTPPPEPPDDLTGLEVRSDPSGAAVWINNRYEGTTPVVIEGLPAGTYRLLLRREGYQDELAWLDYPGGPMRYHVTLTPVMGFVQVDVFPRDAEVELDGRRVPRGITPVPVGSYEVVVRAFGFEPWYGRVEVWENIVSSVAVDLEPAPFSIHAPDLARDAVNPENPGLLGSVEARFAVSGPGRGAVSVLDGQRREVFREELPPFTTWSQRWEWHPPARLPDGAYSVVLSGSGDDGRTSVQEMPFSIDRSFRIALRTTWSGGAGLLYVPSADVLPAGAFQASVTGLAYANPLTGNLQAPVQLTFRSGLGQDLEIAAAVGAILTDAVPPVAASVSLKWQALAPERPAGVGVALEAKAALQGVPAAGILTTDTFSNFSGLCLGVPIQVAMGPFAILAEAALIVSAWQVDYDSDPVTTASPAAWMYWRAGLMVDAGAFVAGISASARSLPLPGGLLSIGLPVQAGAEASWLLPGTHVLVGAAVAGEFAAVDDWYLMGGVSLGLLY